MKVSDMIAILEAYKTRFGDTDIQAKDEVGELVDFDVADVYRFDEKLIIDA